jgi:hypothetical protein
MKHIICVLLFILLAQFITPLVDSQVQDGKYLLHQNPTQLVEGKPLQPFIEVETLPMVTGTFTEWLKEAGIPSRDWDSIKQITDQESGSCPTKWQGEHTCPTDYIELHDPSTVGIGYGIPQADPAIKMASAGDDWKTNGATQLKWMYGYIIGRYGSVQNAINFKFCTGYCWDTATNSSVYKNTPWY